MNKTLPIVIIVGFLLVACNTYQPYGMPGQGMGPSYSNSGNGQFASNGERIYFTATDNEGNYISYTGGPAYGGMMMGSSLACVDCHGANGQGGIHPMHMQTMDAPPITYEALVEMMAEEADQTPPPTEYSLDDFRKSVVDGQHPDGDSLDQDMPRWQMNDADLADLLNYLKTLP